jgi:predicted nucleic acid-binding protein
VKVLVDTNVVLDVLLKRAPFDRAGVEVLAEVEAGSVAGFLCSTSVTTVYYMARKVMGGAGAQQHIAELMTLFDVACVPRVLFQQALKLGFGDFEDAVLHEAAAGVGAEAIITRNAADFQRARIPVFTPEAFLEHLRSTRTP